MKLLWLAAVVACSSGSAPPPPPMSDPNPPSPPTTPVTDVRVDRRVELISIVTRLGGGDEYRLAPSSPYVTDVERVFRPFAGHPAVAATTALRKQGIAYDAPIVLAVHLDDRLAIDDAGIAAVRAADARWKDLDVAGYVTQLHAFARDSGFDTFFASHAAHHAAVAARLRTVVDAEQPVAWFDSQFGPRKDTRYRVVPGLLNGTRNFGVQRTHGTTREMFQVLGVSGPDGMPTTDDATVGLLVHEMAHSYVNPLFEQHAAELARAGAAMFPFVERRMVAQQYGTWTTMLNESGVRALTVLFMVKKSPEAGRIAVRQELRQGFVWTDELAALLHRRDPKQHPTIEAYMPVVIAWFDQLAARYAKEGLRKLPFLGPVFAVLQAPTTWVAPTDAALASHVGEVQRRYFANSALVAATDQTLATTRGRGLVAFGTAKSNPVVAAVLAKTSWQITADGIQLGARKFAGADLALIAARPRPDDPARGIVIYTATSDAALLGIFGVRHGFHDWQVVRRTPAGWVTVAAGDFPD